MNIMYLDPDPVVCPTLLCDQHLLAQINEARLALEGKWPNHPVTKWAWKNRSHWLWLWCFAVNCCIEYAKRFGKCHASTDRIMSMIVDDRVEDLSKTEVEIECPSWHGDYPDYASYLRARHAEWIRDGKRPAKWTGGRVPQWAQEASP